MNIAPVNRRIPAMGDEAINTVRALETSSLLLPQEELTTEHVFHAGVYLRSCTMRKNSMLTGALIKISTTLIISGDVTIYLDGAPEYFVGYHVLPASAGRKQAIIAHEETSLTMLFATDATTVEEAEAEFTDETNMLASKNSGNNNTVVITGE